MVSSWQVAEQQAPSSFPDSNLGDGDAVTLVISGRSRHTVAVPLSPLLQASEASVLSARLGVEHPMPLELNFVPLIQSQKSGYYLPLYAPF